MCSEECSVLHKLFANVNDLRGKEPICIDLSGAGPTKIVWKNAVLNNLKVDTSKIKNFKRVSIMRHHWSMQQLQCFYEGGNKRYPSTPMAYSAITKIARVVDMRHFVKRNGSEMFFNVPNYPMHLARIDAKFVGKEKSLESRREELVEKLESEKQSKIMEKGNRFIENLTHTRFWSMQNEIKKLESDNSSLRKDNEESKIIIENCISENNRKIDKCNQDLSKAISSSACLKVKNDYLKNQVVEIKNQHNHVKKTLASSECLSRKRKERIKKYQKKIKDYFSPAESTTELITFVTNHTGLSRYNLSNRLYHEKNKNVSKQIFGFHSFEETLFYMQ